jgi:hypothetical protein
MIQYHKFEINGFGYNGDPNLDGAIVRAALKIYSFRRYNHASSSGFQISQILFGSASDPASLNDV